MAAKSPTGKIHPKLRMFANCDPKINAVRAELASSLSVPEISASVPQMRGPGSVPLELSPAEAPPSPGRAVADTQTIVNVFVDLRSPDAPALDGERQRLGSLALVEATVAGVEDLAREEHVAMVTPAESLKFAPPLTMALQNEPEPRRLSFPKGARPGPVLVGIIDVQGFDFAHADFMERQDESLRTRFVRIWDQGGKMRKPPAYAREDKKRYAYGSEITGDHMNAAIAEQLRSKMPAVELEPQSQMRSGSHGTHVASIAAGNRGVCPDSYIAAVLISLPAEDQDRRKSFYDSTRLVDAVEYLLDVAADLGNSLNKGKPLPTSINISLGTNGDAHDGSSPTCRWIENAIATAGRCVTVAAGNAGQEAPSEPGDIGYVMGRIHSSGRIPAKGLETRLQWTVVGNGRTDISENELEIWYSPQDRFRISVLPPGATKWIGPIDERQYIENKQLDDGTFVSIYNEVYHPVNGCNLIAVYLSPNLDPNNIIGIKAGVWTVRLEGVDVRDGQYHCWIERDDPFPVGKVGPKEAWRFPSFFTQESNVDTCQINSLACSPRIISVANLDFKKDRIHISSSQGPTRDGRFKPDVAAFGTDIVAANAFDPDGTSQWISMTGTSMASPFVCGVAAAMLSITPQLNAAQIGGIIQRTARPLVGKTYEWANDSGFGIIDPEACLIEALSFIKRTEVKSS